MQLVAQQRWCAEAGVHEELGDIATDALDDLIAKNGMVTYIRVGRDRRYPVPEQCAALREVAQQPAQERLHPVTPPSTCASADGRRSRPAHRRLRQAGRAARI